MATTFTEGIPTQTSGLVVEPTVPPVSTTSLDTTTNQNRLIQLVRSMPLVSLLFGRNVPHHSVPNEQNRCFIFKCLMIFHLIILIVLIGLTSFSIYYYNIRFYKIQTRPSETLIVCWLLRAIWHTVNSSWALKYYVSDVDYRPNLKLSQTFYNIASILWISLTVVFLGVSPREDLKSPSARICYFLLWITIASYVVPMLAYTFICILLYITLLVFIFFRHGSISLTSFGVPPQLLKKLRVERYKDVLKMIEKPADDEVKKDNSSMENDESHMDSQSTLNTVKEGFVDCVNNEEMLNERLCSICILNINDDDKVFVLPCDMRHLFHRDCLNKWFKRSSECPICRSNITDMLSEKKEEAARSGGSNEGVPNTQDEFTEDSMIHVVINGPEYQGEGENLPEVQNENLTNNHRSLDLSNNDNVLVFSGINYSSRVTRHYEKTISLKTISEKIRSITNQIQPLPIDSELGNELEYVDLELGNSSRPGPRDESPNVNQDAPEPKDDKSNTDNNNSVSSNEENNKEQQQ